MNYNELKKIVDTNKDISKKIYICNFLTCKTEKIMSSRISLVKNIFGQYLVTLWLDYEYGRFEKQETFKNKDLAADYAWQLFTSLK